MKTQDNAEPEGEAGPAFEAGTLGDVLYTSAAMRPVPEAEWESLVLAIASGNEAALHALYDRAHRLVFTLAVRITGSRETAEEVTLDVFHDAWRRASQYHPANGTVLGWIMNQARSRAIDRVRFEQRKKRAAAHPEEAPEAVDTIDPQVLLELKQNGARMKSALGVLPAPERQALEAAYFAGLTHVEIAERFGEPLGTIKTRIRGGLKKLRRVISTEDSR